MSDLIPEEIIPPVTVVAKVDFKKARDASGRSIKKGHIIDLNTMLIIGKKVQSPPHPGEILKAWLKERWMTQKQLAEMVGVEARLITDICNARKQIKPDNALDLELGTKIPAETWLKLQSDFDLMIERKSHKKTLGECSPRNEHKKTQTMKCIENDCAVDELPCLECGACTLCGEHVSGCSELNTTDEQ